MAMELDMHLGGLLSTQEARVTLGYRLVRHDHYFLIVADHRKSFSMDVPKIDQAFLNLCLPTETIAGF